MATATHPIKPSTAVRSHIVSREFNAPRELVWKVNTDPAHLEKWLGPEGVKGYTKSMDFRVGGVYHYAQCSADGSFSAWGKMTYLEISPMDRMVMTQSFSDVDGGIATHPLVPSWPKVMHWVLDFEDLGNKRTRLTVTWLPLEGSSSEELATFDGAREGMNGGWKGTFDKLENYLTAVIAAENIPVMRKYRMKLVAVGDREVRAKRNFDAPRTRVFAALTEVERLKQWFGGPPGWTLDVCEFDARVGGTYRYEWKNDDGSRMGMGGRILEFVPPQRVVTTEKFDEAWYPGGAVGTIELTENDDVTTLSLTVRYDSPAARDEVMRSPMEQGMALGYDNLEDHLTRKQA